MGAKIKGAGSDTLVIDGVCELRGVEYSIISDRIVAGTLLLCGATYDDAESAATGLARERAVPFISAYNDPAVIAGGGTLALEILDDLPSARALVVPVGGGGLIGGIGVAALVARGLSNRAIARELVIPEATAERHIGNAFAKLGLASRAQLAVWAVKHGLVQGNP